MYYDDLISRLRQATKLPMLQALCDEAADEIQELTAADVREVKRGKWIADREDIKWGCSTIRYSCSNCGKLPHFDKETHKFLLSEYCPFCGADMREAGE